MIVRQKSACLRAAASARSCRSVLWPGGWQLASGWYWGRRIRHHSVDCHSAHSNARFLAAIPVRRTSAKGLDATAWVKTLGFWRRRL